MFWKPSKRPVAATTRAKEALGIAPPTVSIVAAPSAAQLAKEAISSALDAPKAAAQIATIPAIPVSHLNFATRYVAQMDGEEERILGEIAKENTDHAQTIATLEAALADTRKLRAFYQSAPGFLGDEAEAPPPAKPKRLRGRTAAESANPNFKPEGQEAANE